MQALSPLDQASINAIRFLSVDAIQKAKSGHPGLPLGFAPMAYDLFARHLRHSPKNPYWAGRDRFVLSAGHGSALLYSLLHLSGYDLSLDDLKAFRQWGSKTPGHPEYGHTAGVEMTTGPLGQGLSTSVGMAIAQKHLAARFNRPGFPLLDYHIFVVVGDGCMQEGISAEASSLAGHLGLNNLIVLYDDNQITIDGRTRLSFSEDVVQRYEAYGWFCQSLQGDGHDLDGLDQAIAQAKAQNKPALIKIQSIIGFGSPKQDSSGAHGSPLGDGMEATRKALNWPYSPFEVPSEVYEHFSRLQAAWAKEEADWNQLFAAYAQAHPDLAKAFKEAEKNQWDVSLLDQLEFKVGEKIATRQASGHVLAAVMPKSPNFMGGSADLTPSNNTHFPGAEDFNAQEPQGRYLRFGVREHAMGAIINGIGLSKMLKAYGATFLSFSDYLLPSLRVAALSKYPGIFIFTHDSIGLGEDGPTHQPIEQVGYLRALPGLVSFRPADAYETREAWRFALNHQGPVCLALSRQGLPVLDQTKLGSATQGVARGGYILSDRQDFQVLLLATGSEVSLALEAQKRLDQAGTPARVVSLPSVELFEAQEKQYQAQVVPPSCKQRIVIEAGLIRGWEGYIGEQGRFIGMRSFGASAPAADLFQHFGITVEAVVRAAQEMVSA